MGAKETVPNIQSAITHKRLTSIRRRFFNISLILLLTIIVGGTSCFLVAIREIIKQDINKELEQTITLKRISFEAMVNSEIAIVRNMANSPVIADFFSNPHDPLLERFARRELEAYRHSLKSDFLFWINTTDRKLHRNDTLMYTLDTSCAQSYWYEKTLNKTGVYNFNINFNKELQVSKLWVKAPVFNLEGNAVGIVGTGIDLTYFVSALFKEQEGRADILFFNSDGQITGAKDVGLVAETRTLGDIFGEIDEQILAMSENLDHNEIRTFESKRSEIAVAAMSNLGWYIVAAIPLTYDNYANLMTFLFIIMSLVIFLMFLMFNVIVAKLLAPLQNMVEALSQMSSQWTSPEILAQRDDEVGIIARSISDFLDQNRALTKDVYRDSLTEIYNRRFLEMNAERVIKSLSRGNNDLSVLFIDIDFFKKYNDTYGHQKGDECLKIVAKTLEETLMRPDDFVARYGGEEFVVVLPNTDKNGAISVANTVIENVLKQKIEHEKNEPHRVVSISVGITTGNVSHTQKADDYIKFADEALYKSKENGRNRYTFKTFEDLQ